MKLAGLAIVFLSLIGVSAAQHREQRPSRPPEQRHEERHDARPPERHDYDRHDRDDHRDRDWRQDRREHERHEAYERHERREHHEWRPEYRPEYRGYGWHHRGGWRFRIYINIGPRYCHPYRYWDHRYLTLWDGTRWMIADYDIWIVEDWYPNDPIYVYQDDSHYGWYLLYNQRNGEAVHAELW